MLPRSSRPRAAWGTGVYPSKQYFDIKMRCLRQRRHRRRWYLKGADNTPYEKIGDEVRSLAGEVPFEIPDSWEWARLGSVVYNRGQTSPSTEFCYIDIGSIDNKNQKLNPTDTTIAPDKAPSRARKLVDMGDILYSTVRPYLHNMCIIDREFPHIPIASTGFAVLTCHANLLNKYLFYYLMSPDFDAYANNTDNAKGVAYPAINDDRLYKALIPIPPVAEQHRIVSAIDSVNMPLREYGSKEETLRILNTSFPENLKKSILQEAVQGKLVPQDPSDEPAEALLERIRVEKQRLIKEGKVKKDKRESVIFRRDNSHYEKLDGVERCIDDELPFELPKSWCWVRFETALVNRDAKRIPLSVAQRKKLEKKYDYYGASGVIDKVDRYLFDKPLLLIGEDGANLLLRSKPIAFIATGKYWVNNHAHVIDAVGGVDLHYIALFINATNLAPYVTGTAQPKMNQERLNSILVPLPPSAEQHRIVTAFEEIAAIIQQF